ncbi:MAG: carboxy terminal-processing peptidase, partial [Planctomycetota bacterium]|nr:carboxy terminal-processing peptidase [Planctomycetota bacterium]
KLEKLIDNQLSDHDLTIAYTVFHRFQKRVQQRTELVETLIKRDFDFTINETVNQDLSLNEFPKNAAEVEDRWRRQLKYDLLILNSKETQSTATRDRVLLRYRHFAQQIAQTTADDLLEIFLSSLASSFDPHTSYLSPPSYERLRIRMRLNYQGIGAELEQHLGYVAIRKLIPGGDAARQDKLQPKDRIVSVGQGVEAEMIDVTGKTLRDIVQLVRGQEGTTVRLGILPANGGEMTIHQLTRSKIDLKDAAARSVVIEGPVKPNGMPARVGIIKLPSFYVDAEAARNNLADFKSCSRDVGKILKDFQKQQVDVVLLDLRNNGGGSLIESIRLTGLFIDQGPVVQVKDSHQQVKLMLDTDATIAWSGPLVVLTSRMSASASEIFAGAIQDYRRGLILGDHATYGKGTVQQLLDLNRQLFRAPSNNVNLGALKITIQKFYRPNGETTQLRGILPDVILPSRTEASQSDEAKLNFSLPFDQVDATSFTPYRFTNPQLIAQLSKQSTARQAESADLQALKERIKHSQKTQQAKTISLNRQQYLASSASHNLAVEPTSTPPGNPRNPVMEQGPYLTEVLSIVNDYLRLIDKEKISIERKIPE